jgi:alkanesulfonate monooxygenase SsuD/methylene tetrahydromethanopterin reductase-like flavin-dependent oxidoreductase (luciferase family)
MNIGVSFDGFTAYVDALEFAKEAAASGAKSLWMADHLGYREPIVSCLGFASAIPHVRVVPTAVSPYLRHPMPTAMQMATLAEAAPGRVALALGTGNPLFLAESGETIEKPVTVAREFIEALRALWSGEPVQQEATRFRLRGARMMFVPPARIALYLAPMKPQMLTLAGKIADGVVLSAGLSSGFVRESLAHTAAGARAASRDYGALHVAGYISFAASREPARAVEEVRKKLAFLLRNRFIDDNIAHSGIAIDQSAIIEAMARRDYENAARRVPDEAVDTFAVAGTVQQCCDKLLKYREAGLQELVLLLAGTIEDQRYGLQVIRELTG